MTASSAQPPSALAPDARLAELVRELGACEDPGRKAVLHYEAGHICEFSLGQVGEAVTHYLAAFNLDRDFRLSLYALLRLFEQKGDEANLRRLYAAEAKAPRTQTERAAALVDLALLAHREGRKGDAQTALEQALDADPAHLEAAVLFEALGDVDSAGALTALTCRAHHTDDPHRQALALSELSEVLAAAGDTEGARSAALKAVRIGPGLEAAHSATQELLRRIGPTDQLVDCLARRARELTRMQREHAAQLSEAERSELSAEAVAMFCEAARLSMGRLSAPGDALTSLEQAAQLAPDEPWVHQLRMLAFDRLEDRAGAAREAEALLERGARGPHAAGLHFRRAEQSLTEGALESAREQLDLAISSAGDSRAAAAMLDDLLFDEGLHIERLERLRAGAETDANAAVEAALIASHDVGDAAEAQRLFAMAEADERVREMALREAYGACLALDDDAGMYAAIDGLLQLPLEPTERAALAYHRLQDPGASPHELAERLREHMTDPACAPWLPYVLRLRAAERGDWATLALTQTALAEIQANPEDRAAHLCAAARALLRCGRATAAEQALRAALELDPAHPYPLTLLQQALRAAGHQDEEVALLLQAAQQLKSGADAELSLLLAGAAAEASGDDARAARAYQKAAERSPRSVGPAWALLHLSQRNGDHTLALSAQAALAEREREAGGGVESLRLAAMQASAGDPARSNQALASLLDHDPVAAYAAASLALSPEASDTEVARGLDTLVARDSVAQGQWVRTREQWRPSSEGLERDRSRAQALARDGADRWALGSAVRDGQPRVEHLEALAYASSDGALAADLRAESLLQRRAQASAYHPLYADLETAGIEDSGDWNAACAGAVLQGAPPGVDPNLRAAAYERMLDTATGAERAESIRGLAQARLRAGSPVVAATMLRARVDEDANDLASWELLRVAARAAGKPEWVAEACDVLAQKVTGELWAELSEESAAIRMDHLEGDEDVEETLRAVLDRYPQRAIAYERLHDLLGERDDTAALVELVGERIQVVDDAEELAKLFYEQARLCRAEGELDAALGALDNLRLLESDHVAGLALVAEIYTAREDWERAVQSLCELADTQIPPGQRRLALIGAADYLEKKLGRPEQALAQLLLVEGEGLSTASDYVRMADLYEREGDLDKCVRALRAALGESPPAGRDGLLRRIAKLLARQAQPGAASVVWGEVLSAIPTDIEALTERAALLADAGERDAMLVGFESAVRDELLGKPTDAFVYRKLRASADLRGDTDLEQRVLAALAMLGEANELELAWLRQHPLDPQFDPGAVLSDAELAVLLTPAADPGYRQLAMPVMRAALSMEPLDPAQFGVGRSERVPPRTAHALRDEARAMLVAVGGELADFYVGGPEPEAVRAAPKGFATHLVVGSALLAPLAPEPRYAMAMQVAASRLACLPLMHRDDHQASRLLQAAFEAGERPLAPTLDRSGLSELGARLFRAAGRKDRKAMEEAVLALDDGGVGAQSFVVRYRQHVRRLALLLGGDLGAALHDFAPGTTPARSLSESPSARDLLRAWLSPQMGELRSKLGMDP